MDPKSSLTRLYLNMFDGILGWISMDIFLDTFQWLVNAFFEVPGWYNAVHVASLNMTPHFLRIK